PASRQLTVKFGASGYFQVKQFSLAAKDADRSMAADKVDLILEQTFFCAIDPAQRRRYAQKSFELLNSGGRLAGVLFASHFEKPGPPFGGGAAEYRRIFEEFFIIQKLEPAYNSIAPRAGNELFIELLKA
ncbi:MAG TPA: hypothetical protein PKC40_09370, partial [Saprospiraceae bacterium]|nr:hypothetical protein [Saprospiraceae bacterium]